MRGSRQPKKLDADGLWSYGLKLLGGRALSLGEVREKLQQRAETDSDVGSVLGKLQEYGYVNDTRFAESFATLRKENDGLGRIRVVRDLRQRRVSSALADSAVAQVFAGSDETEQVEAYLARKFRNVNLGEMLQDPRKLQSVYRRLRYAGFASGVAVNVLKRYAAQAEALEDGADEPEE